MPSFECTLYPPDWEFFEQSNDISEKTTLTEVNETDTIGFGGGDELTATIASDCGTAGPGQCADNATTEAGV